MGTSEGRAVKLSNAHCGSLPPRFSRPSPTTNHGKRATPAGKAGTERAQAAPRRPTTEPLTPNPSAKGREGYAPHRLSPCLSLLRPAAGGVFSFRAPLKPPLLLKYEAASSPAEAAGRRRGAAGRCGRPPPRRNVSLFGRRGPGPPQGRCVRELSAVLSPSPAASGPPVRHEAKGSGAARSRQLLALPCERVLLLSRNHRMAWGWERA